MPTSVAALSKKIGSKKLPEFPASFQKACEKSMSLAAEWLVRTQIRDSWPAWDANKGRYPYHVRMDVAKRAEEPQMYSTCWKTSRAAQGMYSAYLVTGDDRYLDSANLATNYVCTLQFFEPGYEALHGTFIEDSPLGPHLAIRDGMEAIQAFVNRYLITGEDRFLHRSLIGTDWLLKSFKNEQYPWGTHWPMSADKKSNKTKHFCLYAAGLVFAQMAAVTGNPAYATRGAAPNMDYLLKHHILGNGALGNKSGSETSHHASSTAYGNVISNDDGVGVAMLATYRVTGKRKYLDAAVGMGDFWAATDLEPAALASYSSIALFLSDLYRLTGDAKYLPRIQEYTNKTLALQCMEKRDPMIYGGYIGEDMAGTYDKRSKPTDWVDLRITSYTLISLAKIAAKKPGQWGCAYSCFGF